MPKRVVSLSWMALYKDTAYMNTINYITAYE